MQKIIYSKDYNGHKKGEAEMVSNNDAHFLIEGGIASLVRGVFGSEDKMMRPETKVESRGERRVKRRKESQKEVKKGYKIK